MSTYFFSLEKKRAHARLITAINTLGGKIVSSVALITRAWVSFYVLLFTSDRLDVGQQDFFLSHVTQWLSSAERALCDGSFMLAECKEALDGMQMG